MIKLKPETSVVAQINGEYNGIDYGTFERALRSIVENHKSGKTEITTIVETTFRLTAEEAKTGKIDHVLYDEPLVPDTPKPPSVVVCAAIRKNGMIITGARHFDSIMRAQVDAAKETFGGWEQGFIDQYGTFLTREEAWKIADAQGQIRRPTGWEKSLQPRDARVGDDGFLFSENLY